MSQTKKIVIAVIIAAIVVGGGVYFWPNTKTINTITPVPEAENTIGKYENTTYGFSLVFPPSWGKVKESTETGSVYKIVRLTAENDVDRYIRILVLERGTNVPDSDMFIAKYNQTYLTGNSEAGYAYSSSDSFLKTDEIKAIAATFELTGVSPLTANWKTYTDSKVGFTFKYPTDSSMNSEKGMQGRVFNVTVNDLNTMEDAPLGYDRANALKDKAILAASPNTSVAGISFGQAVHDSLERLAIPNALAKGLTILGQIDVCDVQFDRQAIIYKDNYQIILSWMYAGSDIENNNAHYFKTDSANCGLTTTNWNDSGKFYTDLVAGKTDAVSQKWFTDFYAIVDSFRFTK
ncbi:MAG: hypothetical protein WCT40_03260 [Candidatus Magasanikbacteria bacterium]|jgi:hypothetical protein